MLPHISDQYNMDTTSELTHSTIKIQYQLNTRITNNRNTGMWQQFEC